MGSRLCESEASKPLNHTRLASTVIDASPDLSERIKDAALGLMARSGGHVQGSGPKAVGHLSYD